VHHECSSEGIRDAREVIDPQFTQSPQFVLEFSETPMRILLKIETMNVVRSFKQASPCGRAARAGGGDPDQAVQWPVAATRSAARTGCGR
jgi:hypothetical protein